MLLILVRRYYNKQKLKMKLVEDIYKNKGLRREDVKALLEWAEKQPHLPPVSEFQMQLFLHSCYSSIELAKTTVDNFYTYKAHCPEFFANRNPNNAALKTMLDAILFIDLPKPTPEGYKVVFCKIMVSDSHSYSFNDHAKLFDMATMQWLNDEGPSEGLVIVVDMSGFTFGHLMKMHVLSVKKILMYLQEAMPVRLKGLHYINVGNVMDGLMGLIKPFLKKEVAECFYFHDCNYDKLFNYVPRECFPKEYGGSLDSVSVVHENAKKRFLDHEKYFVEDEKLIADESKRPGKPRDVNDIFGVEGSFKKLDID